MKQTPNVPAEGSDKYIQNCGLALRHIISYSKVPVGLRISRGGGESPLRSGTRRPEMSQFVS